VPGLLKIVTCGRIFDEGTIYIILSIFRFNEMVQYISEAMMKLSLEYIVMNLFK
jgi:hypothetical protein